MSTEYPIRVLSVCTSDTAGGAARAAYRIHDGVRDIGVESQMFVKNKGSIDPDVHPLLEFLPNSKLYHAVDWCAAKIKNKWQHHIWSNYPHSDGNYKSDLRSTRIHGALQTFNYDALHLHWINQRFLSIDELLRVNKPIVWTLHDSWPFCGICHYFLDCNGYQHNCGNCPQLSSNNIHDLSYEVLRHKAEIYKKLDLHIVSPSIWLADCARASTLFGNLDIRVIPNCLDTDIFHPLTPDIISKFAEVQNAELSRILREATQEKGLEKPFILYGAMNAATDRRKGFSSLLSALQILDDSGFQAHLVVFGADKSELSINFKNIDVTFLGYISDISALVALYSCADIMVVPSLTENLSCAIMEAMSCATPVVAFNIGGNSDLIDHKVNGYLAREYDSSDLANGIRWCLANNTNNNLGTSARNKVMLNYSQPVVATAYKKLYEELTAN